MHEPLWDAFGKRPVAALSALHYDEGDWDTCYVSATFSSEGDAPTHFAVLIPLLYEHQLAVLAAPHAKRLAVSIANLMTRYKEDALHPVHTLNLPLARVPLSASTETVLLEDDAGTYAVNFFPEFEVPTDEDETICRFLWALFHWVLVHLGDDDLRVFTLSNLDLLCAFAAKAQITASHSPLRRSDCRDLIAKLGWKLPGGL